MKLLLSPWVYVGLLPFLYVAGVGLSDLSASQIPLAVLAFVLGLALVLYNAFGLPHATIVFSIGSLFFALEVIAALASPTAFGSAASEFGWGTMLVGPVFLFLGLVGTGDGPGVRLVGLQLALADGFLLLAAPAVRASTGRPDSAAGLLTATFAGFYQQVGGIVELVAGRPNVSLPLRASNDPWFVAFASLAVLATLLSFLRPVTGRGGRLPARFEAERAPVPDPATMALYSPRFREALRTRSLARGAPPGQYPGISGLLGAGLAAGVFLAALYVDPPGALILTAVAVAATLVIVYLVLRPSD